MENIPSKNKKTPNTGKKRVSYSQFSNWYECPKHWFLDNVKNLKQPSDNLSTIFGTACHEAIQLYIKTLYTKSSKDADEIDMYQIFKSTFDKELTGKKVGHTEEEYKEYTEDAKNIIQCFTNVSNRIKHFPSSKYEFIGVEDEIIMDIKNNIEFICYIDLVLKEKNTGRYRIIDIKTSRQGWNVYQKQDEKKIAQILLYKAFFSRKYDIDIDMIDVEFFILRRKLWENSTYPQSRIQLFTPKNNQKCVAKALNNFSEFVVECFNEDGTFMTDEKKYFKNPGPRNKNCKYCVHKGVNCDGKSDIPKEDLE